MLCCVLHLLDTSSQLISPFLIPTEAWGPSLLVPFTPPPRWVPCNRFHHVSQGSPWAPLRWLPFTIDRAPQVDRLFIAYEWIGKGAGLIRCMALRVFVYLSNRWRLKRWTVRLIQQKASVALLSIVDVLYTNSSAQSPHWWTHCVSWRSETCH